MRTAGGPKRKSRFNTSTFSVEDLSDHSVRRAELKKKLVSVPMPFQLYVSHFAGSL